MKIIVDANIVFSGILNSNGKIGDLLLNSNRIFKFIGPEFLRKEIFKHYDRLSKISGLSIERIKESEFQIYKNLTFISEEQISEWAWLAANKLVEDIDPNDTPYVAFALHFDCKIWSGDKQLIKGLSSKGFNDFHSTNELFSILSKKLA